PTHCGRRVLTMELLDGVPIDDPAAITDWGADPTALVEELIRAWFMTALRDGVFHADVHAGNLLLLRDGRMGVIDWGIVGRLDPETLHFFRRAIEGSLGDESAWVDVAAHITKIYGPMLQQMFGYDDAAMAQFVRSQVEPLLTRPFGEVNLSEFITMSPPRDGPPPTWRERRRLIVQLMDNEGQGSTFDRAQFLLGKQVVYFGSYGHLFQPGTQLQSDPTFYEAFPALPPRPAGSSPPP